MKRHPALRPLSRDHHRGLVEARRLRRAAAEGHGALLAAAATFIEFAEIETLDHFRAEEELVFPLVDPPPELVVQALVEHARIRSLVERLRRSVEAGEVDPALATVLGDMLTDHVHLEERDLFPLIEELAGAEALSRLELPERGPGSPAGGAVIDLGGALTGRGPLWGTATEDLNATLLSWGAGDGTPEHVNDERDVLVVVLAGSGTVRLDGIDHHVSQTQAIVVLKGSARSIVAGPGGMRYLSVHRRRAGLELKRFGVT